MRKDLKVAVIGTGPSALMAAEIISAAGISVSIFEKRKTPARKLLIAGSSGLNVTHDTPVVNLPSQYSGSETFWKNIFSQFNSKDWLEFIHSLGIKTFKGTSRRFFVENMKAGILVANWKKRLEQQHVTWHFNHQVQNFHLLKSSQIELEFENKPQQIFDAVVFCLGGASWEPPHEKIVWPQIFKDRKIGFEPFTASNVGFEVDWKPEFLKEAEGLPLKNILLRTSKGLLQGDLVITHYGLEGTPIYAIGTQGKAHIDLKPDLSHEQIREKLSGLKENLSPIRRIKKQLKLTDSALALLFHETPPQDLKDISKMTKRLKNFPIILKKKGNLERAISSAGGLKLHELSSELMIHKCPGVFAAGEMLDWDTTTGGFLIQACVSQGYIAGKGVLKYLKAPKVKPRKRLQQLK
ncbi:MAG: TIGR03862 family flavoprotein [Proteobacteria bacterium]|nr:TIGR03862 family flavoprotein [Pseudomonadota bacterium]